DRASALRANTDGDVVHGVPAQTPQPAAGAAARAGARGQHAPRHPRGAAYMSAVAIRSVLILATTMRRAPMRGAIALTIGVSLCGSAGVGRAQTCVGDCDGNGRPTIDELIRGVNILLSGTRLEQCRSLDTNGNGAVDVNELVRAVDDVLFGCGVMPPTPPPTSTASATPTETLPPTPTATPTMSGPEPNGMWREDQYRLALSTCLDAITSAIAQSIALQSPCTYTVTETENQVTVVDCTGASATGDVDAAGVAHFDLPPAQQTQDGC